MKLVSDEHVTGTLCAAGCRGVYSVQQVGAYWWLSGRGHDELTMLALPPRGKPFVRLEDAQGYAARLDAVRAVESQVSGT